MQDILCIYYSRTGITEKAMKMVAEGTNAELVCLEDGVTRTGKGSYLRCAMEAVQITSHPVYYPKTERPLNEYKLVLIGTPVWAGRCCSVVRSFLKQYGYMLKNTGLLVTRSTPNNHKEVFHQMNEYLPKTYAFANSVNGTDNGFEFWCNEFVGSANRFIQKLNEENKESEEKESV